MSAAEDEAEKVAILAAPLSMDASEELRDLQEVAIRDTERAVKAAMGTAGRARREVQLRQREAEAMAPLVRESAREEIAKLLPRLDAAQAKLDEHRSARRDHELTMQAEQLFGDLASRLAGSEAFAVAVFSVGNHKGYSICLDFVAFGCEGNYSASFFRNN